MAITQKGIYYPNNYNAEADILSDLQQMAESIDDVIEETQYDDTELAGKVATIEGEQITQNNEIADLQERLQDAENNQLTGQASGESIDLSDSADSRVRSIELDGNSEQESTTGKNLLPDYLETETKNGVTLTNNGDGTYTLNGTATAATVFVFPSSKWVSFGDNGTYYFSSNYYINGLAYAMYYGSGQLAFWKTSSGTFTLEAQLSNARFQISIDSGKAFSNQLITPMIEKGSTATSFEPYTGGIASPNPSYPQEIHSTGDNVNLLPNTLSSQSIGGVDFTKNNDGTIHATGTAVGLFKLIIGTTTLKAGNYYFSGCPKGGASNTYKMRLGTGTEEGNHLGTDTGDGVAVTLTEETVVNANLYIYGGQTVDIIFKPKLEKGTVATPYTPYGMGSVNEKVQNKNLININNWVKGRINNSTGNIEYANNTTAMTISNNSITFTVSQAWNSGIASDFMPITSGSYYFKYSHDKKVTVYADTYNSQKERISRIMSYTEDSSPTTRILTISDSSIRYIRIHFEVAAVDTYVVSDMQLEQGTTATDYVAHEEQNISIPCQQPMRAIGEYKDTFVKVDGNWYERHYIGQVVLDGTETTFSYTTNYQGFRYKLEDANLTSSNPQNDLMCSHFTVSTIRGYNGAAEPPTIRTYYGTTGLDAKYIFICDGNTDVNVFKTWLSNNNVELIYVLATPVDLPCTEEQIEALESLEKARTYKPVTHISSEDVVPATIDLTYVKDLETVINNLS